MKMLDSQVQKELEDWERMMRLGRARERRKRIEQEKEDNHWNFIAGKLVAEYLKTDLDIPVYKGKDAAAKNAESFKPLENILAYLAANKELTERIKKGDNASRQGSC